MRLFDERGAPPQPRRRPAFFAISRLGGEKYPDPVRVKRRSKASRQRSTHAPTALSASVCVRAPSDNANINASRPRAEYAHDTLRLRKSACKATTISDRPSIGRSLSHPRAIDQITRTGHAQMIGLGPARSNPWLRWARRARGFGSAGHRLMLRQMSRREDAAALLRPRHSENRLNLVVRPVVRPAITNQQNLTKTLFLLVAGGGFEPPTSGL